MIFGQKHIREYLGAMKQKKLGIDFDDVLMDFNSALALFHNTKYGSNYTRADIRSFDLGVTWNVPIEEARRRVEEFYHSDEHMEARPIVGAQLALRRLDEIYELHIVTARSDHMYTKTGQWLETHFPGYFSGIHFTNQFLESGAKRTKASVSEELGLHMFVDDHIENLRDMQAIGTGAFLFDTPWNRHEDTPPHITRVHSWEEIAEKLL